MYCTTGCCQRTGNQISERSWVITTFIMDTVKFVQPFHFPSARLIMPYLIELGESSQLNSIPNPALPLMYVNAGFKRAPAHLDSPLSQKGWWLLGATDTKLKISWLVFFFFFFITIKSIDQFICRHALFTCLSFISLRALCCCCLTLDFTIKHQLSELLQ